MLVELCMWEAKAAQVISIVVVAWLASQIGLRSLSTEVMRSSTATA